MNKYSPECYHLIRDEDELVNFLNILPENNNNEKYLIALLYRGKYETPKHNRTLCVKRIVTNKSNILPKIRQLECPIGSYTYKDNPIKQDTLAVYITPNPRDMVKACKNTVSLIMKDICETNPKFPNPYTVSLTAIHNSPAKKVFVDFDIDSKDDYNSLYTLAKDNLGLGNFYMIETNGGYHILADLRKKDQFVNKKGWHKSLQKVSDIVGDCMLPLPGCVQGNFIPKCFY